MPLCKECGETYSGVCHLSIKFIYPGGQLAYGITIDCPPSTTRVILQQLTRQHYIAANQRGASIGGEVFIVENWLWQRGKSYGSSLGIEILIR